MSAVRAMMPGSASPVLVIARIQQLRGREPDLLRARVEPNQRTAKQVRSRGYMNATEQTVIATGRPGAMIAPLLLPIEIPWRTRGSRRGTFRYVWAPGMAGPPTRGERATRAKGFRRTHGHRGQVHNKARREPILVRHQSRRRPRRGAQRRGLTH